MERKLIVLAEINCLDYLNSEGIYPNEFYTDPMIFRNRTFLFENVDIIIIFAGSCRFHTRHILDIASNLFSRRDNEKDDGVRSVTVLSDKEMPAFYRYYKYTTKITELQEYNKRTLKKKNSDVLTKVYLGEKGVECQTFLSDLSSTVTLLKEEYREKVKKDDELLKLIKKPKFE